jgi:dynein heavy chain
LTEIVRGNLSPLQRKIIVALVTTDVHARDIVENLNKENVASTNDFGW